MAKTVLIHGYAIDLRVPSVREPRGEDAGFEAFADAVKRGEAVPFRWSLPWEVPLIQAADARNYRALYEAERVRIDADDLHRDLANLLAEQQPSTVVCHSMGCALLWKHLQRQALPESVRDIVFVQADLPEEPDPLSADAVHRLEKGELRLHNLHNLWDPTLALSAALNGGARAGTVGLRVPFAHNEVFPLRLPWNLHTSSIRDPKLAAWVAAL